jgi:hypothetical protein
MRIGEDLAYWVQRERAYKQSGMDAWADVNRIFIDEED